MFPGDPTIPPTPRKRLPRRTGATILCLRQTSLRPLLPPKPGHLRWPLEIHSQINTLDGITAISITDVASMNIPAVR